MGTRGLGQTSDVISQLTDLRGDEKHLDIHGTDQIAVYPCFDTRQRVPPAPVFSRAPPESTAVNRSRNGESEALLDSIFDHAMVVGSGTREI